MSGSIGMALILGGAVGFVAFLVIGLICWVHLRKKGKELLNAIQREYE